MNRNNGKSPKGELKLNLSPSTMQGDTSRRRVADDDVDDEGSPNDSTSPSSCVSSEAANSPEATSMVLAGCPRCLMYVMLAEEDPKCPKCKSTVLLDFLNNNSKSSKKNRKS